MAKNSAYDEILKEYLEIRQKTLDKIEKAKEKIAEAKASIKADNELLEKATADGDLDAYAEVKADIAKNEEIVKFFEGVISNATNNIDNSVAEAMDLKRKTVAELEKVQKAYVKDFVKAMAPALEIAEEAYKQTYLLKLASNKISNNLLKDKCVMQALGLDALSFIYQLNTIVQTDDYKKAPGAKVAGTNKVVNDWLGEARATVDAEAKKWI